MPKAERKRIEQTDAIWGFMEQKNISAKNIALMEEALESDSPELRELAGAVLQMARIAPRRKNRRKKLAKDHRALLVTLHEMGLLDCYWLEEDYVCEEVYEAIWEDARRTRLEDLIEPECEDGALDDSPF